MRHLGVKNLTIAGVIAVLIAVLVPVAGAQDVSKGSIAGVVRDATSAVVGDAEVTLSSPFGEKKTKTNGVGEYVFLNLNPGSDYAVTVQKLAELAEFYGVPVSELLPGDVMPTLMAPAPKLVIDLERMAALPKDKAGPLSRYVATIQSQRGDYNGRVLSIRQEDLRSLAVIYDKTPADLTEELISWGILDSDARGAIDTF